MLKKYCLENDRDWDEGIDWMLFAVRESPQDSTGFSPFEMLFGRKVRGPLKVLKDQWVQPSPLPNITVAKYIDNLWKRLASVRRIASQNFGNAQERMKKNQKKTVTRSLNKGHKVLIFFPIPGSPLRNKYFGPYVVSRKVSPTNYIVQTPDRQKSSQLVHINLMKSYIKRKSEDT